MKRKPSKTAEMLRRIEGISPEQVAVFATHCRKSAEAAAKLGEVREEARLWLKYSVYMKRSHQGFVREGFSRADSRRIFRTWAERI